MQKEF